MDGRDLFDIFEQFAHLDKEQHDLESKVTRGPLTSSYINYLSWLIPPLLLLPKRKSK